MADRPKFKQHEEEAMQALKKFWEAMVTVDPNEDKGEEEKNLHLSQLAEVRTHVHALQRVVLCNAMKREYPDYFRG